MELTDHFLIATPTTEKSLFSGSVIYITRHTLNQGAVGVIINKPVGSSLANMFKDMDITQYNPSWGNNSLYLGGPINPNNGFFLHKPVNNQECCYELTGNKDYLADVNKSNIGLL